MLFFQRLLLLYLTEPHIVIVEKYPLKKTSSKISHFCQSQKSHAKMCACLRVCVYLEQTYCFLFFYYYSRVNLAKGFWAVRACLALDSVALASFRQ